MRTGHKILVSKQDVKRQNLGVYEGCCWMIRKVWTGSA